MSDQDRTAADRLAQLEDRLIAAKGEAFTSTRQIIQARRLTVFAGQWTHLARKKAKGNEAGALRLALIHLRRALEAIEDANR